MKWTGDVIVKWGPAVLVMVLIFIASSIPSESMPNAGSWDVVFKKGGHLLGYALLAVCILHGLDLTSNRTWLIALLICGLYALSDEYHQSFVAGRNATLVDVGIDLFGASMGAWLFIQFRKLWVKGSISQHGWKSQL